LCAKLLVDLVRLAPVKLKRMLDMQVTPEKSLTGKPSQGARGDSSLAVPANGPEPVNELDAVLGTGDDNPRLPLQLSLSLMLRLSFAGDIC